MLVILKGTSVQAFLATGRGWQLIPPARLEGRDFDEFRRECADFVRFRSIDNLPYHRKLIELAEQNRRPAYDDALEAFCTDLIGLAPDDGETYFYRGLVRESLGRRSEARADFQTAARQLAESLLHGQVSSANRE